MGVVRPGAGDHPPEAVSAIIHSQFSSIHFYHAQSFFLALLTIPSHLTLSSHYPSNPFMVFLLAFPLSPLIQLSFSPIALHSFSPYDQTTATLSAQLSQTSLLIHQFSFVLPHFSLDPYASLHTYFSDISSPLHSVSFSPKLPYSMFQPHTVQSVQLLLHTTFSLHPSSVLDI